jgi:hypothetical protein
MFATNRGLGQYFRARAIQVRSEREIEEEEIVWPVGGVAGGYIAC